jgi:hypothetical protein
MDSVIGTLGGVVVTAAAGPATAMITGRQQRASLERKLQQDVAGKIRDERRTAFMEYLKAYDVAMGKAYSVLNAYQPRTPGQPLRPPAFEIVAETEMASVNRAYLMITITASGQTREAAGECTATL